MNSELYGLFRLKSVAYKLALVLSFTLWLTHQGLAWGQTGHRVVGKIAEFHLSERAKEKINQVLKGESLAMVSTWMDHIKSDPAFDETHPWHYVTLADHEKYDASRRVPEGDIIWAIHKMTKELKDKSYSRDEAFALKCLVHLIGDIHQPLHVGRPGDRGGNDVAVEYFWEDSNLHRVWDSGIIDKQKLSYTEYAEWIHRPEKRKVEKWLKAGVEDWAYESMEYREGIYDLPSSGKINYRYNYLHLETVNQRLLQAGLRLAKVLNEIYG